jgi:trans-aconitate 2-methyltransferase
VGHDEVAGTDGGQPPAQASAGHQRPGGAGAGTPWDAPTYDRISEPQLQWAGDVLARLQGLPPDATVLDVGCGTGRVTELLAGLVPGGRVLAVDASSEMVALARERLGARAEISCRDALDLQLDGEVDAIVSTATLHWVRDHERLWPVLARALRSGGWLEAQCGGEGNIARVREVIAQVVREQAPELVGFSPWNFAGAEETAERLRRSGFEQVRCWLEPRPTEPEDPAAFIRTSILAAHLERLAPEWREPFAAAVAERVRLPLDYVRLNISAKRAILG